MHMNKETKDIEFYISEDLESDVLYNSNDDPNRVFAVVELNPFRVDEENGPPTSVDISIGLNITTTRPVRTHDDHEEYIVVEETCDITVTPDDDKAERANRNVETAQDVDLSIISCSDIMNKYTTSFDADNGVYVTGATVLAIKVKKTVEEKVKDIKKNTDLVYTADSDDEGSADERTDSNMNGEILDNGLSENLSITVEMRDEECVDLRIGEPASDFNTVSDPETATVDSEADSEDVFDEKENDLPEVDLSRCNLCGITVNSIELMEMHVLRCRGIKRRRNTSFSCKRRRHCCLFSMPTFVDTHFI